MAVDMEIMRRLDSLDADPSNKLRESLFKATRREPDREAQVYSLASENKLPPDTVDRNLDEVKRNQQLKQIDVNDLLAKYPKTANYMSDESNAAISVDDLDIMKRLEANGRGPDPIGGIADYLGAFAGGILQVPGMGLKGAGEIIEAGGRTLQRAAGAVLPDDAMEAIAGVDVPVPLPSEPLKYAGTNIMRTAQQFEPDKPSIGTDIAGGLGQVSAQILATMFAPTAALPLMFTSGVEQQAARQEQTGTKGATIEADQALLMGGAVTAITEQLGIERLLKRLPKGAQDAIQNRLIDVMMAGGGEAVQEVSEGIAQGLIEQASTNPNAEIFEGLGREAIAAGGTGAIVRSIVHLATRGRGTSSVGEAENIVQSEQDQARIDEGISLSQESKTRGRSTERFSAFMESAYGEQSVYLDQEAVQQAVDSGLEVPPSVLAQVNVTGVAVSVPMRDFLSSPDFAAALRDDVRLRPEGLTPKELAAGAGQDAIKALIDKANKSAEVKTEAEQIYSDVVADLVATGRMRQGEAQYSAEIIPAYATVKAQSLGIPVKEVYERMGLKIVGPDKGNIGAVEVSPEVTLDQARSTGYEGDDVAEATEWQRSVDKGLDMSKEARMQRAEEMFSGSAVTDDWGDLKPVYHITEGDIVKFDDAMLGTATKHPTSMLGHFFGAQEDVQYAGGKQNPATLEVYINLQSPYEIDSSDFERLLEHGRPDVHSQIDELNSELDEFSVHLDDNGQLFAISNETGRPIDIENLPDEYSGSINDLQNIADEYTDYDFRDQTGNQKVIEFMSSERDRLINDGYDGIIIKPDGLHSWPELDYENYVVFDPKNIRSVNAAFDPDFKDSSSLLAQSQAAPLSTTQNFKGVTIAETRTIAETGEEVSIEQDAQKVWDRLQKRKNMAQTLKDCLNA